MNKKYLFTSFFLAFYTFLSFSQDCDGERYKEQVFWGVDAEYGIPYGEASQPTLLNPNATQELTLDFYEPENDDLEARPLIIWAFGGAFVAGTSLSPDLIELCTEFSELGYVNASINYRLSTDLIWDNETDNAYEAVKKAMQDMKAAVRFFYKDAETENRFRIDTNRIYVGGVSAGAIAAVHLAYLDEVDEIPLSILDEVLAEGGLEGQSGNAGYSSKVKGVINLCGGVLDTAWINNNDLPIVSLHGDADGVVPYGNETITLLGLDLPFNGSHIVHQRMEDLGIQNAFYTFHGAGHTPFVLNDPYMDTTVNVVREFLYDLNCELSFSDGETLAGNIYPNPTGGMSQIKFEGTIPSDVFLNVYDVSGKRIPISSNKTGASITMDGTYLPKGVYFLHLLREGSKKRVWSGKWVVY